MERVHGSSNRSGGFLERFSYSFSCSRYVAGNGFHIVGAHTDSPCLKLKPVSKVIKSGFLEVDCTNIWRWSVAYMV
ncbi:hypothetical protein HAX54_024477 [Datura stramonium]|uniref:Aspartyl aminopeptidase n=1 Tax=Datura stramonium TaxID=4076 RepID=A0ABS8UZT0_DATST|nr:hypothetical protein [Datura stramonium]